MTSRAVPASIIVPIYWPSHMTPMIRRIEVLPIPASREVDLGPKSIWAIMVKKRVPLVPFLIAFMVPIIVETDVRDGLVVDVFSVKVSPVRVAGKHTETVGESADGIVLPRSGEVVLQALAYAEKTR